MNQMALPEDVPDGEALRAFRLAMGWSQREVATRLDVTEKTVRWWETGRGTIPLSRWKGLQWARQQENIRRAELLPEGAREPVSGTPLPYAGKVCAGVPVDVLEVQMGEILVRPALVPKGRAVVVTVAGGSMHPVLWDEDVIVVGLDLEPRTGDLVCVTLPQSGTVVRRLVVVDGEQRLAAEAAGFSPLTAAGPEVHVHGVVVGIAERRFRDD